MKLYRVFSLTAALAASVPIDVSAKEELIEADNDYEYRGMRGLGVGGPNHTKKSGDSEDSYKGSKMKDKMKGSKTVGGGSEKGKSSKKMGGGKTKSTKSGDDNSVKGSNKSSKKGGKTSKLLGAKKVKKKGSKGGLRQVNISIQPAYHGIPMFMAQEMGWFEDLGLEVEFTVFSSGGPQVAAAAEEQAWDVGIAGSPPNVLAGFVDILTIGINNDESAANIVYGAPGVTEWPPTQLSPGMFARTPSSTGDLLLRRCLEAEGVSFTDDNFVGGSQGEIITSLEAGDVSYGALWAPNAYVYENANANAMAFCSGTTAGLPILGGVMAREEYAKDNPDTVARVLAAYLRGVTTMTNRDARELTLEVSRAFYEDFIGTSISTEDMERDLLTRPVFNLDAQLALLDRNEVNGGVSEADGYYSQLGQFMFEQGVIDSSIEPRSYISDEYMQLVSEDPDLREFSYLGAGGGGELEKVNVSIQPAYHGIPMFMAKEMGWFEELGLDVNFTLYSSGGPQVAAAAEEQAWDIGIAGSPPNVIAGNVDILTIAINNDEGAANIVYGAPGVTEWPPTELTSGMFARTPTSTGDLLLRRCLEEEGVSFTDDNFAGGSQGEIISALEAGDVTYGALWAPNAYVYENANSDAMAVCSGTTVGLPVLGGVMVRRAYGEDNPDVVARILAGYLRGVTTMKNRAARETTLEVSRTFYEDFVGTSISTADMERDLLTRPVFNLDGQLTLLDRNDVNGDVSEADSYYSQLAQFMFEQGVIDSFIEPSSYITDEYMQLVSEDPILRSFSYEGAEDS